MQNKNNFATINATLYDIRRYDDLFNKLLIIIKNDFAQIIFVVQQNNRAA